MAGLPSHLLIYPHIIRAMAPSRAAKKPRITRRKRLKRPAAAPDRNAAVAPEPLAAGQLVFQEDALVAAQVGGRYLYGRYMTYIDILEYMETLKLSS